MAERREGTDRLVEELLDRLGHTWPQSDAQLDAWLHERAVPTEDQTWIKDVVRRRMDEARGSSGAVPVAVAAKPITTPRAPARPLSHDDLATLDRELLELVQARVPLPMGLEACALDLEKGRLGNVLAALREDVDAGLPLSEAMARQGSALPPIYQALVAAGEASGDLSSSLAILSQQAETDRDIDERTRDALAYPAVLLFVTIVGLAGAFALVAEPFETIFEGMNVEVPAPTALTLGLGTLLRKSLVVLVPLLVLGAFGVARLFLRSGAWLARASIFSRTPDRVIAEVARSLAAFLEKGVPTTTAFRALVAAYGDRLPSRALEGVLARLEDGATLASALRAEPAFPRTFSWLVGAAEERGTLPGTLLDLAARHERRFERRIKFIESFAPSVALIVMSVVIGFGVLSLFLPIFKLQNALMN